MAAMKYSLLLLFCALPVCGQSVSFGIKAGVPVTAGQGTDDNRYTFATQRWTAGVTAELSLPANLSVGVDVLYRRFSYTTDFTEVGGGRTAANIGHWEVPVYAKYRFGGQLARPFVEAGFAFDRARTSGTSECLGGATLCGIPPTATFSSSAWGRGFLVGGGVEIKAAFLKIAPEVRYTRWQKGVFQDQALAVGSDRPNQVEALVGVRF